jgi:alpha-1,3-mannosyltransferase
MRIVHVVRQFFPAIGGLESIVQELAARQVAAGHTVRVVTLDRLFETGRGEKLPPRDSVAGIEIIRIPFFGSSRYPIALSVVKHVRDADIVHVHAIDFFFDFLAWTRPHGTGLVVSTHGGFFHNSFAARLKQIYFATVTRASMLCYDGVVALSETDHAQFSCIRPRGLVCIENGVNTTKFHDAGSPSPVKSMIWIGRFSENERLHRLISFLVAVRRFDPAWRLVMAGEPGNSDVSKLLELAAQAKVVDALRIEYPPDDDGLRRLIGQCAIIVNCSDHEGNGNAVIEGMSAGLFPLLSDFAPFRRLVARAGIGLNVNFDDVDAAAVFLAHWSEVSGGYAAARARAIAAAAACGWDNVLSRYQSLYDDVVGSRRRTILDVPVFVGSRSAAVERIDAEYRGLKPAIVAFANANALNIASNNCKFRDVLKRSVVLNDGFGVDAASRILFEARFPQNLNGTDFTPYYFLHTKHAYRIFFLGGSSGVAERAAAKLMAICGGRHRIAGCQNGYSRSGDAMAITAKILASGADVVLVAMGNPLQEIWLAEHLAATGCRLGFGVGALFDFLSGDVTRAPHWVRAARLEWVYRLLREPSRLWRRYILGNPLFLMRVLGQWFSGARV